MNKYIQPILFGSLIALASSVVFAAGQEQEEDTSGYWVTNGIKNAVKGVADFGRAVGGDEEAGRRLHGDFRKMAGGLNSAGKRVGDEVHEFVTESIPDGTRAIGEDAHAVGECATTHAKAAGTAASQLGKDFSTASTGGSEAERDAARKKLPMGLGEASKWVDDMTAQHRAQDKDTSTSTDSGTTRTDDELRAKQGAAVAAHNERHAADTATATAAHSTTAPAPAVEDPKED